MRTRPHGTWLILGAVAASACQTSTPVVPVEKIAKVASKVGPCMEWGDHRVPMDFGPYSEAAERDYWRGNCMSVELGVRASLEAAKREAERNNSHGFEQNMQVAGEFRWVYEQMRCDVYWPLDAWYGAVSPRCVEEPAPPPPPPPSLPAPPPAAGGDPDPTGCPGCYPGWPLPAEGWPTPSNPAQPPPQGYWIMVCSQGSSGYTYGSAEDCAAQLEVSCFGVGGSCFWNPGTP